MISSHLYFYKHALNDMGVYLSKEKRTKSINLKLHICQIIKTKWSK